MANDGLTGGGQAGCSDVGVTEPPFHRAALHTAWSLPVMGVVEALVEEGCNLWPTHSCIWNTVPIPAIQESCNGTVAATMNAESAAGHNISVAKAEF